jgi:hypothetical protein
MRGRDVYTGGCHLKSGRQAGEVATTKLRFIMCALHYNLHRLTS